MKQTRIEILARLLKAEQITAEEFVALSEVEIRYYNPYSPVNPPSSTPYTNPYSSRTTTITNPYSSGITVTYSNEFI